MTKRNRSTSKNHQQTQSSATVGKRVEVIVEKDGNITIPWYYEGIEDALEGVGEVQFPGKAVELKNEDKVKFSKPGRLCG